MEAKEKAENLVNQFYSKNDKEGLLVNKYWSNAKFCALIAVDEIIQAIRFTDAKSDLGYVGYWQEVKQEIEKL
jgi:hypothetical protein